MKQYLLGLSLLLLPCLMVAQEEQPDLEITRSFDAARASEILAALQADYPVRFFFKAEELPQRSFTLNFEAAPLEEVMETLFQFSELGYMRYDARSIIIMPQRVIDEVYTADYYKALEKTVRQEEQPVENQPEQTVVGELEALDPSGKAVVSGRITDQETGEPILGATIFHPASGQGAATDADGRYAIPLPTGDQELRVQFVGYQNISKEILVLSDGELDIRMTNTAVNLSEIVVEAEAADANIDRAQAGVEQLDIKTIEKLPTLLGEADVVKTLLLLPGVSTIGEGASGFNVRGGQVDQNLIQQDDGFIFNASHALGFFSTFNTDLIQDVKLYKGNIPAQFGGRVASVMDVEMRDGDFEEFGLKGAVSPISSRISIETPIVKGKSSVLGGFRSSYLNYLLPLGTVPEVRRSSAFFYDANLRYTHRLTDSHILTLSGYLSHDDFVFNDEFGFDYDTFMGQLIYRTLFNEKMFNRLSVTASRYASNQENLEGVQAAKLETGIDYLKVRDLFSYVPNKDLRLDGGFDAIRYRVNPGRQEPLDPEQSQISVQELTDDEAFEGALFANAEYEFTSALQLSAGIRYNLYRYLGPKTVFEYANPDRPEIGEETGVTEFGAGETIATYTTLEPRVSMRYRFNSRTSVKGGYSRTSQFINQIFNTATPTPTSQWQLSTQHIEPVRSHNYTIGLFRNFDDNVWETSLEVYYRNIDQTFDYKDFAALNVNDQLETQLLEGEGRAYGVELSIKKRQGLFNGWLSYTYSRSERLIEGINLGEYYPSNFDIPQNLSLVFNYQPNQRNTFTLNFNFSRGRPTTFPFGNFEDRSGLVIPIYSQRNQLRIPNYHRMDIAYTLGQGYNKTKKIKTSWTFSIYNLYGRKNAFSVFYSQAPFQGVQANQLAILGSVFPSVRMNIEFL